MGISYSAVKTQVPEAWQIGKDYYALTDLFPACAGSYAEHFPIKIPLPSVEDVQHLVGSRHSFVNSAVFRVTDYFQSVDELLSRIEELKKRKTDRATEAHLRNFFVWAGDDPIQFIADFDDLEDRDAGDEYVLCCPVRQYRHMDSWGDEPGRFVGYEEDDNETD